VGGLHFKDVDISSLDEFTHKLETDKEVFERFKSDPTGELKKLGITLDPTSVIGKRLIECVSKSQGLPARGRCWVYSSSGHCIIIPLPPEGPDR